MSQGATKILYLSHANPEIYGMVREAMPPGFELVTLDRDSDAERLARVADCEVIIVGATRLTREVIAGAPRLRLVLHQGVGYHDTVDVAALAERQIPLAITLSGSTVAVAEMAILLMLAVYRHLLLADAGTRQGRWPNFDLRPRSYELRGKTVGIIGMGRIGHAVAARLKPFETKVVYYDKYAILPDARAAELNARAVGFETVLEEADILTLHLPLTDETRHMIDAAALARMKPGSILINAARGGIVDETALVEALSSGRLAGAGLDVFEIEPVPTDNPILGLPNVVVFPHLGGGTRDAFVEKMAGVFDNVQRFYRGEPLRDQVPHT